MKFERARTNQQINTRKIEIIEACVALYDQSGFDGVNLKAISDRTSIGRSTIYTYYKTKEEIFLDVIIEDAKSWSKNLEINFQQSDEITKENFAKLLTQSFIEHKRFVKLFTMLYSTIEKNCSLEKLTEFKKNFAVCLTSFIGIIDEYFKGIPSEKKLDILIAISSYVNGLYPMIDLNEKQKQAIKDSGFMLYRTNFEDLCYKGILALTQLS